MNHDSEFTKVQKRCIAADMNLKRSVSRRIYFESTINNKNEKITFLSSQLRSKESKINEMFFERQADFLKLGQMKKQIEELNKKNQNLQIKNLRQTERNQMERKIFHHDLCSIHNSTPIPLPCEDLHKVEYVKGTQVCQTIKV